MSEIGVPFGDNLRQLNIFFFSILLHRVDSFKLTTFARRPVPRGAQSIGQWIRLLDYMGWAAVASNIALVCFEMDDPFWLGDELGIVSNTWGILTQEI